MECVHMPKELKKLYPCDQCAAVLSSQGSLKTHKDALHREKRFKCYCGRMFSQKGAMDTHIRGIHMKERNIKCQHCDSGKCVAVFNQVLQLIISFISIPEFNWTKATR